MELTTGATGAPRGEIETRLAARRGAVARQDRHDRLVAGLRLTVFCGAIALGWLSIGTGRVTAAWLAVPAVAFLALVVVHERVLRARARATRATGFYEMALARLDDRWTGKGQDGARFSSAEHPYAQDLDLFGAGSLFELLCTARTRTGEERLAQWLLAPADPDEVSARQGAVSDLRDRLNLREDLAVLGEDVRAGVDASTLARWGLAPRLLPAWLALVVVTQLGAILVAAILWRLGAGPVPLMLMVVVDVIVGRLMNGPVARVLGGVERPAQELQVLALLLGRLERETFEHARLLALRSAMAGPPRASTRIARLERHVARLEWAYNQLFAPIAVLLLWRPIHALLIEHWRRENGSRVERWLDAIADLEALSSLAGYAYEHPGDVFPEVVPLGPGQRAEIRGEALRHPLLPVAACVPNPVSLGGGAPHALLVSGSNMSGKSTYLRTVGINVVLALAGAPVRAARLRLTPLQIGATLRIQDSLQAGRSRFYAEITRLKVLADLAAHEPPLLFLLDELLHGTNSRDRRVGAEAILHGLLARGAMGIVTTHDLALTELAGDAREVENGHFEDQVRDGAIAFDYRLRPGVVAHSNALALMRAVGLDV
jgi:hypothetical protein